MLRFRLLLLASLLTSVVSHGQDLSVSAGGGGGGGGGGQNPFRAPSNFFRSMADSEPIGGVSAALEAFDEENSDLLGSVPPASMTASEAKTALRRLFIDAGAGDYLNTAATAELSQRPGGLLGSALVLLAKGKFGPALGCALVNLEKNPDDPPAVLNLAALALAGGKANEALALLTPLMASKDLGGGSWDMPGTLHRDYLVAYAHALRGERDRALPLARKVFEAAPHLAEAGRLLALLEEGEKKRRFFIMAAYRHGGKLMVKESPPESKKAGEADADPLVEGETIGPALEELYDLSRGKPGQLAPIEVPGDPLALMAVGKVYTEGMVLAMNRFSHLGNQVVGPALKNFEALPLPAPFKRRAMHLYNQATIAWLNSPKVMRAKLDRDALGTEYQKRVEEEVDRCFEERVPVQERHRKESEGPLTQADLIRMIDELNVPAQNAMNRLRPLLKRYFVAIDTDYTLNTSVMNGMLSHVGPGSLRTALVASAEAARANAEQARYAAISNQLNLLGGFRDPKALSRAEGEDGKGGDCTDEQAKFSLSVDLGVVGVEISCNSLSVEVEEPLLPPVLSASAEIGIDTKGVVTAFVGPKQNIGVGTMKEGIYVTVDENGFRDAGGKVESKAFAGAGPVSTAYKTGEWSGSFFPGPSPAGMPRWD